MGQVFEAGPTGLRGLGKAAAASRSRGRGDEKSSLFLSAELLYCSRAGTPWALCQGPWSHRRFRSQTPTPRSRSLILFVLAASGCDRPQEELLSRVPRYGGRHDSFVLQLGKLLSVVWLGLIANDLNQVARATSHETLNLPQFRTPSRRRSILEALMKPCTQLLTL